MPSRPLKAIRLVQGPKVNYALMASAAILGQLVVALWVLFNESTDSPCYQGDQGFQLYHAGKSALFLCARLLHKAISSMTIACQKVIGIPLYAYAHIFKWAEFRPRFLIANR